MTSTLKTDTLTGVSTAGSISVTGEGNSTATNLQQGLSKCWVKFDGTASSSHINDSFNTSGFNDVTTGDYIISIANNMNSAHFSTTSSIGNNSSSNAGINRQEQTGSNDSGTFHFESTETGDTSDSNADVAGCSSTIHGDLA